ncbi:MAG: isoprenoid biosynthesis glyoxalase ElbB [Planctomycetota bacterium]
MHVGVILSGCGVFDGSEIHEAVAVLLSLDRRGVRVTCLAPEGELDEIDHRTSEATGAKRSILTESARIARGEIMPLSDVKGGDFDAIVLPGGFGAAKNLCSFAMDGAACGVHPDVERALVEAHESGTPIGFACIAPAVAARVFGPRETNPTLTIGTDAATAAGLTELGATHQEAEPDAIVIDDANRIVSTPAYMSATRVSQVFDGIDAMVERVLEMANQTASA